ALFRGATDFITAGSARDIADTGSEACKDGIEMFDHIFFAADHHAIAAFESPNTAAGADIDVMNFFGGELLGAANVVDVIGIPAIDQDVFRFERGQQIMDGLVHHSGRDHQPDGARFLKLFYEVLQRGRSDRLVAFQFADRILRPVEHDALVAAFDQAPRHVRPHSAEANHSELHNDLLY